MNLKNRLLNKPSALMMIGMICFLIANQPSFIHIAKMNPDTIDFARGVLMGLSIGFNLLAVLIYGRNRRRAR